MSETGFWIITAILPLLLQVPKPPEPALRTGLPAPAGALKKILKKQKIYVDIWGATKYTNHCSEFGGIAQLGERMTGSHEVRGSIPLVSTKQVLDEHLFL